MHSKSKGITGVRIALIFIAVGMLLFTFIYISSGDHLWNIYPGTQRPPLGSTCGSGYMDVQAGRIDTQPGQIDNICFSHGSVSGESCYAAYMEGAAPSKVISASYDGRDISQFILGTDTDTDYFGNWRTCFGIDSSGADSYVRSLGYASDARHVFRVVIRFQGPPIQCYDEGDCACIYKEGVLCECVNNQCVETPIEQTAENPILLYGTIILICGMAGLGVYIKRK